MGSPLSKKIYLILTLPAALLLVYLSSFFPHLVERYYAVGLNRYIISNLSAITGIFPFSLGEAILGLLLLRAAWGLMGAIVKLIKGKRAIRYIVRGFMLNLLILGSLVYFAFILLWGLNYYRLPFSQLARLEVRPSTVQELASVCDDLIGRANELRGRVSQDQEGVMQLKGNEAKIFQQAYLGYQAAAEIYPQLGGRFGRPKGVFFSKAMAYTGISGVYFPFTGEANVNTVIPAVLLPSTTCHEMAHQRGFAREDEANYLAYVTCTLHPDPDFQYSGTVLAMINAMNMLSSHDLEKYRELRKKYSPGLQRDLAHLTAFWDKHEGPVERISNNINDLYLKSNRQSDGVHSYGRMVDLLIAEYRAKRNLH